MSVKLRSVVQQAIHTFSNFGNFQTSIVDEAKLSKLLAMVNDLRFSDLHIPSLLVNSQGETLQPKDPVAHISIAETCDATVGVFILKEGAKIPLHDHPQMYGILRVLHGVLEIQSYSLLEEVENNPSSTFYYSKPLKAKKNQPVRVSQNDICSVLTPKENNIHEVVCVSGPAAFLDILSPPYSNDFSEKAARSCHYFCEECKLDDGTVMLSQIMSPW